MSEVERWKKEFGLTKVECEVLHLAAQGKKMKVISYDLDMPLESVEQIWRTLFGKMNVSSIGEMITKALGKSIGKKSP